MAYFANGSEGMVFDEQCSNCKYGEEACPIALVQMGYNYKALGNETATGILDELIGNDGTCAMFNEFREDFEIDNTNEKIIAKNYKRLRDMYNKALA
jgi:formate hydrogenlyase subunit 6/NADH:ubiquinone oxidoreductase subunit I